MPQNQIDKKVKSQLIKSGQQKINWAGKHMPIINQLVEEYYEAQPLAGYTIVTSVHMEAKTAWLVQ